MTHKKTALIVVDMVKGFLYPEVNGKKCALYVKGAMSIVPEIKKEVCKLERDDIIICMCDSHCKYDHEFKNWPEHCINESGEDELIEEFKNDIYNNRELFVMSKYRFSSFFGFGLEECLVIGNIDRVIITGVCTEFCVFATALDAAYRDYEVIIPRKCVYPFNKKLGEQKLEYLQKFLGVKIK
jgi:nicotinamidase/pyrazinamidase